MQLTTSDDSTVSDLAARVAAGAACMDESNSTLRYAVND